jgi:hypothetical protein
MRGCLFDPNFLFPNIKLEQILEVEFHLSSFFKTSPASFAEYDFKSFIWQYDRMIAWNNEKENSSSNRTEIRNPLYG